MNHVIDIRMTEAALGGGDTVIATSGVGSCVVVILYDRVMKYGGMAHALLPHEQEPHVPTPLLIGETRVSKYADSAIRLLLASMSAQGSRSEHLVSKLVGGAHMFSLLTQEAPIGDENVNSARHTLEMLGIVIETEVVGGTVGRNVRFTCGNGVVEITTKV
jgi:chemotaxis protein CheD